MREKISKRFLLPDNLGIIKDIFRNYKSAAKRRNIEFELLLEDFRILIESPCFYCKETNSLSPYGYHKKSTFRYNGVDRVNNNVGYTIENVVPCCKICNNSKSTLNTEEFKIWITKIYNNYIKK